MEIQIHVFSLKGSLGGLGSKAVKIVAFVVFKFCLEV